MKFCYNCGAEIEEGDKFCVECGAELSLVDVEDNQSRNDEKMAKENDELLRKKQLQEEARLNEEIKRQEEMRLNEERQRQEEMRLDQEKRRQEAEMREARRLEEERKQREEDRKRLEKLDIENIEKRRIENEQRQLKKKRDRNTVAFLLVILALIAVLISVMYMNEYNKKHNDNNNADSSEVSTSGKNNPDLTVAPINPESTKSSVTETTTQSETVANATESLDDSSEERQYLDKEDIPKYFDGNLTLRQICTFFSAVEYAAAWERYNSREELFNEIVEGIWYQLPDFECGKFQEMGDDKFVYEYLQYKYDEIKELFMIMFDENEFDSFASNRNGYRYGAIIDKERNIFSIFGGNQQSDDFYDNYTDSIEFYSENGTYYIVYNAWIRFTAIKKEDGKLHIERFEKIEF